MPVFLIPVLFAAGVAAGKIAREREEKKKREAEEAERQYQERRSQENARRLREEARLNELRKEKERKERERKQREWEEQVGRERREREEREAKERAQREKEKADKERAEREAIQKSRLERIRRENEERLRKEKEEAERRRQAEIAERNAALARARELELKTQRAIEAARREKDEALRQRVLGIPPDVRPSPDDIRRARKQHAYTPGKLNIAIVGQSGVGKSSLLNAFRVLKPGDAAYASTGVNETTANVTAYPDPRHHDIVWYDVPGADTPEVQGWDYFMARGLYSFDAMVIVFGDRFTMTVMTLIKNARQCGIPFFLVRTKVDRLVEGIVNDEEVDENEAREIVKKSTREVVERALKDAGTVPVYIVEKEKLAELVRVTAEWAGVRFDEEVLLKDILGLRPKGMVEEVDQEDHDWLY